MSVKLRKRKNQDGTALLYLDIYNKGERVRKNLHHLKLANPTTPEIRQKNKEKVMQAEVICQELALDLTNNEYGRVSDVGKKTLVVDWMQLYASKYTKKDIRNIDGALNRFKDFLSSRKQEKLTFQQLSATLIEDFIGFLEGKSKGEGASSYYRRFAKMVKQAYREGLMKKNVLEFVDRKPRGKARKKDILTLDELVILASTPISSEQVRSAFLFSCVTGLRWCDVKPLEWENLDLANKRLTIVQNKTENSVTIPLNITAVQLLPDTEDKTGLVFDLPTADGSNKTVKAWVKRAGITKAITWHNARHSFGTNLILEGNDVVTSSKLLGHATLNHTNRYVDTANELKQRATDSIVFELKKK